MYIILCILVAVGAQGQQISTANTLTPNAATVSPLAPVQPGALNPPFDPNRYGNNGRYRPSYNPYFNKAGNEVPILTYSQTQDIDGTYAFSFSTADGKQAEERGFLKDVYINKDGQPEGIQVVQGSYSYISPDGTPIQVSYIADENGFRPSGVHIPSDGRSVPVAPIGSDVSRYNNPYYNRYNPNYLAHNSRYHPFHRSINRPYHYDPSANNKYNPQYNQYYSGYNQYDPSNNYRYNQYNPRNNHYDNRFNGFNNRFNNYNRFNNPEYPYDNLVAHQIDNGTRNN